MNHKVILTKAIDKAIAGGWDTPSKDFHVSEWTGKGEMLNNLGVKYGIVFNLPETLLGNIYHPTDLIFNHDFVKALWGVTHPDKQALLGDGVGDLGQPEWQYHLQQMVIADDPIAYLGEHLS